VAYVSSITAGLLTLVGEGISIDAVGVDGDVDVDINGMP
jgi:hypothetical protein